jgi:hypothetical protein
MNDCRLTAKLLLALASSFILGSEFHETHHILLFDGSGSLQLNCQLGWHPCYITLAWTTYKISLLRTPLFLHVYALLQKVVCLAVA